MTDPVAAYVKALEHELQTGHTTEHSHRPALKALLESIRANVTATNEPGRVVCGAPDFVVKRQPGPVTLGYVETKDLGKSLDDAERSDQLGRYRRSLENFILTDYLEFRRYVNGERRESITLGESSKAGKIKLEDRAEQLLVSFLKDFLDHRPERITTAKDLAERLARLTHIIRDTIVEAFENNVASPLLTELRQAFASRLIPDLQDKKKTPEFADMLAQTIGYGLFAARCNHNSKDPFRRLGAAGEIPKTNPFLRRLFETMTGTELDDEPFASFVDDLVQVLDAADVIKILSQFGARTKRQDPVVHFYETFLATYDPKLRKVRGVFYTPEPVVSYIVRSVDILLKGQFGVSEGLADTVTVKHPSRRGKKHEEVSKDVHKVLILDPACGTGTFLYWLIDHIREGFRERHNAGLWSSYIKDHLLPRVFGFELLMAPYAVAHLKLGLQLAGFDLPPLERQAWAYDFSGKDRLGIYLTNTLEESEPDIEPLLANLRVISDEANAASEIKRDLPIMVILGNPPYSNFGQMNKGKWFSDILSDWKPPDEKKWNPDDFMKFIRWGQWRIEQTGAGVLAFITRNTYLEGLTHCKMRKSLLDTFSEIYLLDLHGSHREHDAPPDGGTDRNVFDIQWGVAIGLFVKLPNVSKPPVLRYAEIWGEREEKYEYLFANSIKSTDWQTLTPQAPTYYFVPRQTGIDAEYDGFPSLLDAFVHQNSGLQTKKDALAIHFTEESLKDVLKDIRRLSVEELRSTYHLGDDGRDWTVALAKEDVEKTKRGRNTQVLYRPFDYRWTYYTGKTKGFLAYPRADITTHLLKPNVALISMRQIAGTADVCEALVSSHAVTDRSLYSSKGTPYMFPLYLYRELLSAGDRQDVMLEVQTFTGADSERVPNFHRAFIDRFQKGLNLAFIPVGHGNLKETFGPEDVLNYIYAITYSPGYRRRYADSIRKDYPRIPVTADKSIFRKLCRLGGELVRLHLFEEAPNVKLRPSFPMKGGNVVEKGFPLYRSSGEVELHGSKALKQGRVYINNVQFFEGISGDVWSCYLGGYQVCAKWLEDRRGLDLGRLGDLDRYVTIVAVVSQTLNIMQYLDEAVPSWPIV